MSAQQAAKQAQQAAERAQHKAAEDARQLKRELGAEREARGRAEEEQKALAAQVSWPHLNYTILITALGMAATYGRC
jgi:hypothetical protein